MDNCEPTSLMRPDERRCYGRPPRTVHPKSAMLTAASLVHRSTAETTPPRTPLPTSPPPLSPLSSSFSTPRRTCLNAAATSTPKAPALTPPKSLAPTPPKSPATAPEPALPSASPLPTNRHCIFNCKHESTTQYCRFPVHDNKRCQYWLKFFKISDQHLKDDEKLRKLGELRVCLKHFNESQHMAKTRMKTTPTRLQKDAALATITSGAALTAAGTTAAGIKPASGLGIPDDIRNRLRSKQPPQLQSAMGNITPKRTNSISSVTSTLSHTSSDADSPTPLAASTEMTTTKSIAPLGTSNSNLSIAGAFKNRKVYMITEKCDDTSKHHSNGSGGKISGLPPQKRKMYLIMEQDNSNGVVVGTRGGKIAKTECEEPSLISKKLTLFADRCDGELTQKFEKILPEILNRIQGVKTTSSNMHITSNNNSKLQQPHAEQHHVRDTVAATEDEEAITKLKVISETESVARQPITLPPKKNRTKIITNAMEQQPSSAATPVIVTTSSFSNSRCTINGRLMEPQAPPKECGTLAQQKNINLSTDFLFLMKMLPKLESIPEPHKHHVKNCIEKIITQNSTVFGL